MASAHYEPDTHRKAPQVSSQPRPVEVDLLPLRPQAARRIMREHGVSAKGGATIPLAWIKDGSHLEGSSLVSGNEVRSPFHTLSAVSSTVSISSEQSWSASRQTTQQRQAVVTTAIYPGGENQPTSRAPVGRTDPGVVSTLPVRTVIVGALND